MVGDIQEGLKLKGSSIKTAVLFLVEKIKLWYIYFVRMPINNLKNIEKMKIKEIDIGFFLCYIVVIKVKGDDRWKT